MYYTDFCEGFKRQRPNYTCDEVLLSTGLNVVVQYLINYNKNTLLKVSESSNRSQTRTELLESREMHVAG